jgi:hypothetical protein
MSIDINNLQELYASSFEWKKEQEERKKRTHEEFLLRLKDSSERFMEELEEEIEERLIYGAKRGRKTVRFESRMIFSRPFGNVKVSTLVYGWRTRKGWDTDRFKEIGLDATPFETISKKLENKGIKIKNISDSNKGFGFWIEASFE